MDLSSSVVLMGSGHRGKREWLFIVRTLPDKTWPATQRHETLKNPMGRAAAGSLIKIKVSLLPSEVGWPESKTRPTTGCDLGRARTLLQNIKAMCSFFLFSFALAVCYHSS